MTCGIYLITHLASGRGYVGQSRDIDRRWKEHGATRKPRSHLEKALRRYGRDAFRFEVLEVCPPELLDERERYHIARLGTLAPLGFNREPGGHAPGAPCQETRELIRRGTERRWRTDEDYRNRMKKVLKENQARAVSSAKAKWENDPEYQQRTRARLLEQQRRASEAARLKKENPVRQSNDNTVDIECTVKRETDKAPLIDHGGESEVWMPKSQIKNVSKNGRTVTLTVTEWIAYEKGLI